MKKPVCLLCVFFLVFSAAGCGAEQAAPASADAENVSESVASNPVPGPESASSEAQSTEPEEYESEYIEYTWGEDAPENHGVDPSALESFHSILEGYEIYTFLLVKDGVIIDEYYKEGDSRDTVFRMASCTKSVSGALIGIAIDQGIIASVDVKLPEYFPRLAGTDKQDITIGHLLGHVSGIEWREWAGGDYFGRLSRSDNWVDFVLNQPVEAIPGEVFNYSTGGSHLLGAVLQEAAGKTAHEFAVENLFKPLGMESVQWRSDPQGVTDGGNGISMTARDAAKFGQLYLNGGEWGGKQIISREWVEESTKYQFAGSPGTGEYGYSWWLKNFGGYDTYYAMGHGGQYIIVIPETDSVVVMASRLSDTYVPQYLFYEHIIPIL